MDLQHHRSVIENIERLSTLYQLGLLDSEIEPAFDRLTRLAQQTLGAPTVLISLIDKDRQFFKSQIGLPEPWASKRETPLSHSFCQYVVSSDAPLIVSDARQDPVLATNLAIADLNVIAYAGTPLRTADGTTIGSFCAIHSMPHEWTETELTLLHDLGAIAATEIELRSVIKLQHKLLDQATESEKRYTLLFNNSMDGIFLTSPDGSIIDVNPAACEMFGYDAETLKSKGRSLVIDPTDPRLMPALKTRAETGTFKGELRMLHAGGTTIEVDLTSNIFQDSQGRSLTSMIMRDITARKQAEIKLVQSEEQFRSVVASRSEGIVVQDKEGLILICNAAAEQILGLSVAQMMGRSSLDPQWRAIHEDGSPFPGETHPAMVTLTTGEAQHNVVMGVHKPDGRLTWISINSEPIQLKSEDSQFAVVASFIDITNRKAAERREFELRLEKERVQILTSFFQNAAHEFRTPLSVIGISAYMMVQLDEPAARLKRKDQIQQQIERIAKLVDMLLLLVELENLPPFDPKPVGVANLLTETCRNLMVPYSHRKMVALSLPPTIPQVLGEENTLRAIFEQLLDNAYRFSPPNGQNSVTGGATDTEVWLDFTDEGLGIAPADQDDIFKTFWRKDNAHSTPGFGLGLTIVMRLVERSRGTISFKSVVGEGSTFHVKLPRYVG